MIKVLHLSYSKSNTGAGIAANRIHSCIHKFGNKEIKSILRINRSEKNQKDVIATSNKLSIIYNIFKKYFERLFIKFINYPDNNFHSISGFPSLKHNEINKLNIDIIHIHWIQHEMISIEEIGKIKYPIIWTLHDCWPFCSTEHYPLDDKDVRYTNGYKIENIFKFSEYVDKICFKRKKNNWGKNISLIAPSKWIGSCAKNSLLMKDKKVVVIPNPIDTEAFSPKNKIDARKFLKINPHKKVILFGSIDGGIDPRKGADLLKEVLKLLTIPKNEFQLLIFGNKKKDRNVFKEDSIEIINLGKIESIQKLAITYSAADLFVIPSRIESFGQTAAEAQSCGTPVIGFGIGGLKDIVINAESGFLIEPYNCKKMAKTIENYLKDDQKISKLSKASRYNALNNFNYKKVAESHLRLYKQVLDYGKSEFNK